MRKGKFSRFGWSTPIDPVGPDVIYRDQSHTVICVCVICECRRQGPTKWSTYDTYSSNTSSTS